MKRKWTVALSPVRRQSLSMLRIVAVWRMLPQCTRNSKNLTGTQNVTRETNIGNIHGCYEFTTQKSSVSFVMYMDL